MSEVMAVRLRGLAAMTMVAALFTGGVAMAAKPYPPPSQGSASVDPSRIKLGECAVFSGNGFQAGSPVAIADNGTPIGSTAANTSGEFSFTVCPTKRGRHDLSGSGTGSDGTALTVSATLQVEGVRQNASGQPRDAASPSPSASASPGAVAQEPGPGPDAGSGPIVPAAGENSGVRLLALGLTGVGFALLASLLLLLIARRRQRPAEDVPA